MTAPRARHSESSGLPPTARAFCVNALPLLARRVSGRRILRDSAALLETERWNSFDRFRETANKLESLYAEAGATTSLHPIRTGGPAHSGRWIVPEAEDIVSARLETVRPVRATLDTYAENPSLVAAWSAATPREGVTAPLVVLDEQETPTKLRPRALAGRIVLTRLDPQDQHPLDRLASLGVAGVIDDTPVPNLPNATRRLELAFGGLRPESTGLRIPVLSVSERIGRRIRRLAARHANPTLRILADIRRYAGVHHVVSGIVPGRSDPQNDIWAVAHSAGTGALDNASGVAVCVEIARVLEALIGAGLLPRPRRSIRLVSGCQCFGSFGYLTGIHRHQKPLAGVGLDTLGAKPGICDGRLQWNAATPMTAGFVHRLGTPILARSLRLINPGYRLDVGSAHSGRETLLADPRYGFPCAFLCTERRQDTPFDSFRTSGDTPSLLSPKGLAVCATAMAATLHVLADAGTEEALAWADAETRLALRKLASLRKTPQTGKADLVRLQHRISLEALRRWFWAGDRTALNACFAEAETRVRQAARHVARPHRSARITSRAAWRIIPRRTAPLAPCPEALPPETARRLAALGLPPWTVYWANGQRRIADVANLLAADTGTPANPNAVADYFELLAANGWVAAMRPDHRIGPARLRADLVALGIRPGMDIIVHSSLSAIGDVAGGADTVVDALLAVLGKSGTLVMPSFNHMEAHVYNPLTTPTKCGAIADAFWRRPQARRSRHPSHPVAAIGPKANIFCDGHEHAGIWTDASPIGKLVQANGWILSLGVSQWASTVYHVAEASAHARCLDNFEPACRLRLVRSDGTVAETPGFAYRRQPCPVSVRETVRRLNRRELCRHGRIGQADSALTPARALWAAHRRRLLARCPNCRIRPVPRHTSPLWPDFLLTDTRRVAT